LCTSALATFTTFGLGGRAFPGLFLLLQLGHGVLQVRNDLFANLLRVFRKGRGFPRRRGGRRTGGGCRRSRRRRCRETGKRLADFHQDQDGVGTGAKAEEVARDADVQLFRSFGETDRDFQQVKITDANGVVDQVDGVSGGSDEEAQVLQGDGDAGVLARVQQAAVDLDVAQGEGDPTHQRGRGFGQLENVDGAVAQVEVHFGENGRGFVSHHRVLDHGEKVGQPVQPKGRSGDVAGDGRFTQGHAQTDGLEVGLGIEEDLGGQRQQVLVQQHLPPSSGLEIRLLEKRTHPQAAGRVEMHVGNLLADTRLAEQNPAVFYAQTQQTNFRVFLQPDNGLEAQVVHTGNKDHADDVTGARST